MASTIWLGVVVLGSNTRSGARSGRVGPPGEPAGAFFRCFIIFRLDGLAAGEVVDAELLVLATVADAVLHGGLYVRDVKVPLVVVGVEPRPDVALRVGREDVRVVLQELLDVLGLERVLALHGEAVADRHGVALDRVRAGARVQGQAPVRLGALDLGLGVHAARAEATALVSRVLALVEVVGPVVVVLVRGRAEGEVHHPLADAAGTDVDVRAECRALAELDPAAGLGLVLARDRGDRPRPGLLVRPRRLRWGRQTAAAEAPARPARVLRGVERGVRPLGVRRVDRRRGRDGDRHARGGLDLRRRRHAVVVEDDLLRRRVGVGRGRLAGWRDRRARLGTALRWGRHVRVLLRQLLLEVLVERRHDRRQRVVIIVVV